MEIYLVGGAVRDELMGLAVNEKDWVVVGSTPQEMLARGFKPVGKEFPVFLHPQTKEEYALARSEKKVSVGYGGFTFQTDPNITLEEDLKRRDLTINAIAKESNGMLIDPYNGAKDLQQKVLRHVSEAFIEDPVRVLRIARFNAKFPDFHIAEETKVLIRKMIESNELNSLVSERIFLELEKVFSYAKPSQFFIVLKELGVLNIIFPHLEINNDSLLIMDNGQNSLVRFCLLFLACNQEQVMSTCKQLKVPKEYKELAILFNNLDINMKLDAKHMLDTLCRLDAYRRPQRLETFINFCQAREKNSHLANRLHHAFSVSSTLNIPALIENKEPKDIPNIIYDARLQAIKAHNVTD